MVGIILLCANMGYTSCNVMDAYAVIVSPTHYDSASECQFDSMEFIAATGLVKPSDVVRVICKEAGSKY
jgi:hypothetical protein